MKLLPAIFATGLTVLLPSCIMPQISTRSPGVTGTVIDARTRQPVTGASITLTDTAWPSAKSKADGRFTLPESRALGVVVGLGCAREIGDWKYYADITVQKDHYTPLRLSIHRMKLIRNDRDHLDAGTVMLVPAGSRKTGAPAQRTDPGEARQGGRYYY